MDFTPTETQQEVTRLAARVLASARPVSVAAAQESAEPGAGSGETYDRALWKEYGQAGLLSLVLPDWLDGDGLGTADAAALLTETGRHAPAVPALATLMLGVLPVTRWGDRALQETALAGVATGDTVLTAALREPSDPMPGVPAATLSGGTVTGVKVGVPYAAEASWVLVPVADGGAAAVAVVSPAAAGVTLTRTHTSAGDPEYTLRLAGAPVAGVLGAGAAEGLYQFALAGACCLADGALAASLDLTTRHIGTRQQFGRPLATFQAAAQHIADVYIAVRTLHLATLSACWRLDAGLDAGPDLDVAAYWLAEYGPAAARTCHHLHGGMGMDVTYPLPRLSALIKDLARFTGGASYRLDRLGERV
ncbi:MAG: acyl-CoA dehydrogenase family protein [Gemmatimonadota bacterium]